MGLSSDSAASSDTTTEPPVFNYSPQLNGTVWFLTAMAGLFVGLRIYVKAWKKRRLWWDDYFLIAGWVRRWR